jgi:hypothetical protein
MESLNGADLDGRSITVNVARAADRRGAASAVAAVAAVVAAAAAVAVAVAAAAAMAAAAVVAVAIAIAIAATAGRRGSSTRVTAGGAGREHRECHFSRCRHLPRRGERHAFAPFAFRGT